MFFKSKKNISKFSIYKHFIRLLSNISSFLFAFFLLICFSFVNSLIILEYLLYPFFQIINNNENIYFISSNLFEVVRSEFKVIYDTSILLSSPFLLTQFIIFLININKKSILIFSFLLIFFFQYF